MSRVWFRLRTRLGPWPHLLDKHAPLPGLVLSSPFLSLGQMAALHQGTYALREELPLAALDCTFAEERTLAAGRSTACGSTPLNLFGSGIRILLLTDRNASAQRLPDSDGDGRLAPCITRWCRPACAPRSGWRVEAGDCRDVHHAAVLIGYGAGAVCPWLALQTARTLAGEEGEARLLKALQVGMAKVMSKMGISVLDSYRSAQLFDILGLSDEVVERVSPAAVAIRRPGFCRDRSGASRFWTAEPDSAELPDYGWVRFRRDDRAESHPWEPQRTRHLQLAVGAARSTQQAAATAPAPAEAWAAYKEPRARARAAVLRDLLEMRPAGPQLSLDQVEQPASLVRRFVSSAMSLGSLSPEAHQTITLAMNQLGGRSNTGEGGEDPDGLSPRARRSAELSAAQQQDQAGCFRPLRRDRRISGARRGVGDQDCARLEAWRRRPASRPQSY